MLCHWRYLQGILDPSSQLLLLLPLAAGDSRPEQPSIALPGCIMLLPPVSQNSPTLVRLLRCTKVLQPALALPASTCKALAVCTNEYSDAVFAHVPSPALIPALFLPAYSLAGTLTVQEWVQQQRMKEYPDGYEHFLKLCLFIICQVAQVGPSASWHGCFICHAASAGGRRNVQRAQQSCTCC